MKTKLTLAVLVCLALPAAARPQEIRLSVPDQPDHLKKMTEELIKLSRTKDPDAKVDLFLKLGEERAKELQKMQEQGKTTHHDALGKSYDKHLKMGAVGAIENGAAKGKDMTGACGRVDQAMSHHVAVLERVLANAPPAARHGLLTALAASQHGREQAMLAHQRGKGKAGSKQACGCDRDHFKQGLKKQGKNDQDCERETADHFKKNHPDGGDCHCSCDHSKGPGKGNNGVGNGIDPQPPGNPPVNDGPGAGPGNPGSKGGPGKAHGPPPGKGPGKPEDDEGPAKGKGPGGEEGPGKGKGPGGPPPGKGKGVGGPPPGKGGGKEELEGDGKLKCGFDRDHFKQGLKKQGKGDDDCERETAEHFKKQHPDGGACHCSCDHSKGGAKGNNGVGNGIDPQPPGNPSVNDGPGAGPGHPGNRGGKGDSPDKGKDSGGPPPGKGKSDKGNDDSDKGKGGPGGKGNGKS